MDEKRPQYRRVEIVAGAETRNELQDFLCETGDVCCDPFVALGLDPLPPRVDRLLLDAGCDSIWLVQSDGMSPTRVRGCRAARGHALTDLLFRDRPTY